MVIDALGGCWTIGQLGGRAAWARYQLTAAVGALAAEQVVGAGCAKRAFEGANPRLC